ncbi:IclR family transcriptional regulator [Halalkalibacter urbisdiaboli]|uniref:IclR family transcriptional regulator n=1 Tax=Halalkalibacter urbisdiaboli TaxID=1960589 RepID=UPI000B440C92|nr:IclR family transcriptional regulator [Halalkalibacter urbisdiaboli]
MESGNEHLLSTVKKALQILQCFSIDEPEKKVTEISASLGMNKSTVSRLLATLASEGFVTKNPETQKYRLGLSIIPLYSVVTANLEVRREAAPYLQQLVTEVGETANITIFQERSIIDILRVNSKQPVQIVTHLGHKNPLHCTSAGKVFLAYQSDSFLTKYFDEELSTTKYSSEPDEFLNMLQNVKTRGYAISIEELQEGVATIAAPIRDYTGKVVYSLSIIGPTHRFDPREPEIIKKTKTYAKEMSYSLGYRGIND